jgi:hypothetical protein
MDKNNPKLKIREKYSDGFSWPATDTEFLYLGLVAYAASFL